MPGTDLFPLEPDYALAEDEQDGVLREASLGGALTERIFAPPRRIFTLEFRNRKTDDVETVRAWKREFAAQFFRFDQKVYLNISGTYRTRSFPVHWLADTLPRKLEGYERWDFQVQFVEAVGEALPTANYPDPANGDQSFFMEEDKGAAVAGTWTLSGADANFHPPGGTGKMKENANTNTTDYFRFIHPGYGFRIWAPKGPTRGIFKVKLNGTDLGNVDQYNASIVASAVLFTKLDVPLGLHTVDLFATNTKNASATGQLITADALEVIF